MTRIASLVLVLGLFLISGCTHDLPTTPASNLIVVRGYLYENEPVTDIQLTGTIALGSEATQAPPINNAQVILYKNSQAFPLTLSAGDSGYYHYAGDDLKVTAADEFKIRIWYENREITGTTVVPPAPETMSISNDTLTFPDRDKMWELREQGISMDSIRKSMTLQVEWQSVSGALYYVHIENIESDPVAVESQFGPRPNRFISAPIAGSEYTIDAMMLTHLGKHRVKVYRVNQEYADLYQSRNQDSRDLNEPLTNIVNGLGIFSAFSSDSTFFYFKD